ncbi:MAG TPA: hypothetical protein ENH87_04715 [Pricia antarctica]|uniref:Pyruvate carboxyltransferase domain-containing protein n=1 Tax=Pricia antarctica TaxID=641691 RepID=A0A831QN64_9FLAO|nr:hypothetical protein [Pricia antarctica]
MFSILDCTLRDGGYYTDWDFDKTLVKEYAQTMENLPIDYIEIGYRSIPMDGYLGEYFYCPKFVMEEIKSFMPSKKLVIILNEKDIRASHVENLLKDCKPFISMVRIAIDPKNFCRAIELAKAVKKMGFEVAFNVMYMSKWKEDPSFLDELIGLESTIDYFYMVDSFGGITPAQLKEVVGLVKSKTEVPLGFHGHNNLEMALINSLEAINQGCTIIDATITGMGRGAGNLRMELLMTYLDSVEPLNLDYNELSAVVSEFEEMKKKYSWGTNLPYMFSGAYSLPQKQVMEWVGMNRYSISSILNALRNQKEDVQDNIRLPFLEKENLFEEAIILGGGKSAINHFQAIKKKVDKGHGICVIHGGTKHVSLYKSLNAAQYYALAGFESEKLLKHFVPPSEVLGTCVFPPYPRKMGTVMPHSIQQVSKELQNIEFTSTSTDSPLVLGIQIALNLGVKRIYLAGFDGYDTTIDPIQFMLAQENQRIINDALALEGISLISITATRYKNIETKSIYSLI